MTGWMDGGKYLFHNQKNMSLTMKRYRYLIVLGILFLWVLVYFGERRVISINILDNGEVTENRPINHSRMPTR